MAAYSDKAICSRITSWIETQMAPIISGYQQKLVDNSSADERAKAIEEIKAARNQLYTRSLTVGSMKFKHMVVGTRYTVPADVQTLIMRNMRQFNLVGRKMKTGHLKNKMWTLYEGLGIGHLQKEHINEDFAMLCRNKVDACLRTKARSFAQNGVYQVTSGEKDVIWQPWTTAWLCPSWDGDWRCPQDTDSIEQSLDAQSPTLDHQAQNCTGKEPHTQNSEFEGLGSLFEPLDWGVSFPQVSWPDTKTDPEVLTSNSFTANPRKRKLDYTEDTIVSPPLDPKRACIQQPASVCTTLTRSCPTSDQEIESLQSISNPSSPISSLTIQTSPQPNIKRFETSCRKVLLDT